MDRASIKEWLEIGNKAVATAGIVVGGVWVLYQWDVLFPKTRADVFASAAKVRTDVSGTLAVKIGLGEGGDTVEGPDCAATPDASWQVSWPVSGSVALKSASALPVRARFDRIEVFEGASGGDAAAAEGLTAVAFRPVGVLDDDAVYIGGLRENRVEAGQEIKVAFLFDLTTRFRCGEHDKLMLFKASADLAAVDPATGRDIADATARKVFVSACQAQPNGYGGCNIEQLEAYGQ